MQTLAKTAPVVSVATKGVKATLAPRCIRCEAPAAFFLCNAQGEPLPRHSGGFCQHCKPTQQSLRAIEAQEWHQLQAKRAERTTLAQDIATMAASMADSQYTGTGPTEAEFVAAGLKLLDLDAELCEDRPFIPGFDDLPASYFETCALVCA
ncbi:hypothetical protein EON80_17810 [bacterium]|nr:MAG: hypothetical protein EON80_17810 [bacterium]